MLEVIYIYIYIYSFFCFKASTLPPAPFWQQVFAGWLLVAGCLFLAAAACWLLALVASHGPGEGLKSLFLLFLLTSGFILVLDVDIGSHLGDPRLLRNLTEEIFLAGVWFLSMLIDLGTSRKSLWRPFGDDFATLDEKI